MNMSSKKLFGSSFPVALSIVVILGLMFSPYVDISLNERGNHITEASSSDNISGYAWSETIGWVSFNCTDPGSSCAPSNHGVTVNSLTGNLSGYAWSEHVGWISFDTAGTLGCPAGTCQAKITNGVLSGWARALATSAPSTGAVTKVINSNVTVPPGITSVTVKTWGAGGGGGRGGTSAAGGAGGGGGFAQADIAVTSGDILSVIVGGGGGGGGIPLNSANSAAGGGGGYSSVSRLGTVLVQAGGGGGGTGGTQTIVGAPGGAGGGASGQSGTNGTQGRGGGGGTASAGGAGGALGGAGGDGFSGTANNGGVGGVGIINGAGGGGSSIGGVSGTSTRMGAGGGAGGFGGGGGEASVTSGFSAGAGGGGSGLTTGTSATLTTGSGATPANISDIDYASSAGLGGAGGAGGVVGGNGASGNSGRVVISYAPTVVIPTGWDGWISLNCSNTGTCGTSSYGVTLSGSSFQGYAWGGDVVGWLQFNPSFGGVTLGSVTAPSLSFSYTPPGNATYNTAKTLEWTVSGASLCLASGGWSGTKTSTDGTYSQSTGPLTVSTGYTLECANALASTSASVSVTVTQPADFSLTSTNSIKANSVSGKSTATTIRVSASNGFNSAVALSAPSSIGGVPVTYTFSDGSLSSGEYTTGSTFSIMSSGTIPAGNHTVTITGIGGGLTRVVNVTLSSSGVDPRFEEI